MQDSEIFGFEYHRENVKRLIWDVHSNCRQMYRSLTDDDPLPDKAINETVLYSYHSMAYAAFMASQTYYLQNYDLLGHSEFDRYFECFRQFSYEFISSRSIKHSMQWTYGYFLELEEAYEDLALLLGETPAERLSK